VIGAAIDDVVPGGGMMPDSPAVPSYSSGISEVPLLGDTIGDNFERTVLAFPERDALVDRAAGKWTRPPCPSAP
jgi:fatty-acyl-CoA synthase